MRGTVDSYKTKSGKRWRIRYELPPGPDGKRRRGTRRGFKRERDAERALRELLGTVDSGTHVDPSSIALAEYLSRWVEGVQVRPTTRSRYRQSIDRHVVPHIGGIRLQALTAEHLDRCYRTLEREGGRHGQPLAPKTVRHAHTTVRTALAAAVKRGYVPRNVADDANPPRLIRPEMKTWTADEVRQFLDHVAEDRWYPMWLLFFTTGLRRGEVIGLRWQDVDLDRGSLTVRHVLTRVDGKTVSTTPKTTKGRRTIALDAATVTALRGWRRRQLADRMAAGPAWQDTGLVFTWEDGTLVHPNLPTEWLRQHAAEARLPRIRLHDARHTWASLALVAGVPAKVVSERLGHATVSITLDVYTHAHPALDAEAADTVAQAILGGS